MHRRTIFVLIALVALLIGGVLVWQDRSGRNAKTALTLTKDGRDATLDYTPQLVTQEGRSPLSGRVCDQAGRRPMAVMYTGDAGTREWITNISKAEIVVEMPHRAVHGGTRLMAIFQCDTPSIVGPLRSGRTDFLSIAGSYDAIFVPWGGSSIVKNLLAHKAVEHIDCNGEVAPSGGDACFRRSDGPSSTMDKASADMTKLYALSQQLGYRQGTRFSGTRFQTDIAMDKRPEVGTLKIGFEKPFRVAYSYDKQTNSYKRFFNKQPDKDYATGQQIAVKNVVVIPARKVPFTTKEDYKSQGLQDPWDGIDEEHKKNDDAQYPNVALGDPWFDVAREGVAYFYMNGREIVGKWSREKGADKPFVFTDGNGQPIIFVEGQTWIEVPEPGRIVHWKQEAEDFSAVLTEDAAE